MFFRLAVPCSLFQNETEVSITFHSEILVDCEWRNRIYKSVLDQIRKDFWQLTEYWHNVVLADIVMWINWPKNRYKWKLLLINSMMNKVGIAKHFHIISLLENVNEFVFPSVEFFIPFFINCMSYNYWIQSIKRFLKSHSLLNFWNHVIDFMPH